MGHTSAEMLANRLRKNRKHRARWARRNGVSCYRLYDRDIPEIPLVIDWYEGNVYLAELRRDATSEADQRAWRTAIQDVLEVASSNIFEKTRARQRGSTQYTRQARTGHRQFVREGGHRFAVNLRDYLDTGLFLDHRETRAMVAEEAADKRMLNLFAYTSTFSIYAAAKGAVTTSVDMSKTYLDWSIENFALNSLDASKHRFVQGDVLSWLHAARENGEQYDVIMLDPPSFSNSKRMTETFDVARDHVMLLRDVCALLAPDGVLYFSSNARRFRLDPETESLGEFVDITRQTVPQDFAQRRPHQCWRMTR